MAELFDIDALDEHDPFEIDSQAAHLFKHAPFGIDDVFEVWQSNPLFYPAIPPAHWLMVAETGTDVLVVPLAPPDSGEAAQCRPIGCYIAAKYLGAWVTIEGLRLDDHASPLTAFPNPLFRHWEYRIRRLVTGAPGRQAAHPNTDPRS